MTLGSWKWVGAGPAPLVGRAPGVGGGHWEWRSHDDGASVAPVVVADSDPAPDTSPDNVVCESCGSLCEIGATVMTPTERVVCRSCSDVCDWCGETVAGDELDRVGTADVCEPCSRILQTCYHCSGVFDPDFSGADVGGFRTLWVCDHCMDRYVFCQSCDTYSEAGESCGECDQCNECCDCADDYVARNKSGDLLPYDFRPREFIFHVGDESVHYMGDEYRDPSVLFLGVEVETENEGDRYRSELVKFVADRLAPTVYVKQDGSLEDGLELVTHPVTYEFFSGWDDFDVTLLGLAERGARSWKSGRCGVHVHLTRSAFLSRSHLFAFSLWWYRNRETVQKIAGRSDYSLDRWASLSAHQGPRDLHYPRLIDKVSGRGYGQTRYSGVNLCNDGTVEVRVFRGTLRPERVRGYVELCAAVFDYTTAITSHDIRAGFLDWSAFFRFVDHTKFPNIATLVAARGVN